MRARIVMATLALVPLAAFGAGSTPAWPTNRNGVAFCYADATHITALDSRGGLIRGYTIAPTDLAPRGMALIDRNDALLLTHGSYEAKSASEHVVARVKATGRFTLEVVLRTAKLDQSGPAHIVSLATKEGDRDLVLMQKARRLAVELTTDAAGRPITVDLCELTEGPNHVVVTYRDRHLVCFLNGQEAIRTGEVRGGLRSWKHAPLVIGSAPNGSHDWSGGVETLALYARSLSPWEVKRNGAALATRRERRPHVDVLKLRAKLVAKSDVPTPAQIQPYSRHLTEYLYEVERVREGRYSAKRIVVSHWGILDRKQLPFKDAPLGEAYDLVLEPFDANRQLESESTSESLGSDVLDVPRYYDVGGLALSYTGNGATGSAASPSAPTKSPRSQGTGLSDDELTSQINDLTGGARAKLVWVSTKIRDDKMNRLQNLPWEEYLLYGESRHCRLMAFDSAEGKRRVLDGTESEHLFPKITRDGTRVIWSDTANACSWIVDWSGTKKRKLLTGGPYWVLALQWDAGTGTEWIYTWDPIRHIKDKVHEEVPGDTDTVYRYPLVGLTPVLEKRELVWNKTRVLYTLSVSGDGKRMATLFPWPKVGVADLTKGTWEARQGERGWGCHANIAPDNSYLFYHMVGNHKQLWMFSPDGAKKWKIDLDENMPGNEGTYDCSYPRWSNDVRYLVCSYPLGGFLREGATAGETCLGRWNADFTAVEKWVQFTPGDGRYRDVVADAWVAPPKQR